MLAKLDPRRWSREEQLAFALTLLLGAAGGLILGYIVYAIGRADGRSFNWWIETSHRPLYGRVWLGPLWWTLSGAFAAAALFYIRKLLPR